MNPSEITRNDDEYTAVAVPICHHCGIRLDADAIISHLRQQLIALADVQKQESLGDVIAELCRRERYGKSS